MIICDVNDFSLWDLVNPNFQRLILHLSAIINFLKFKVDKLQLVSELIESMYKIEDEIIEYEQKTTKLIEKIDKLKYWILFQNRNQRESERIDITELKSNLEEVEKIKLEKMNIIKELVIKKDRIDENLMNVNNDIVQIN